MKLNQLLDRGAPPGIVQAQLDRTFPLVRLEEHHERTLFSFTFLCGNDRPRLAVDYGWRSGRWWYQTRSIKKARRAVIPDRLQAQPQ